MFYYVSSPKGGHTQEGFEEALTFAEATTSDYRIGYWLWDEPSYDKLEEATDWAKKYIQEDPTHLPYINLAGGSGVAGVDFRTHVKKYVSLMGAENIDLLSYDCYPFRLGDSTLDNTKFMCMEVIRSVAYENGGIKTHSFPQSTGFNIARMPNYGEIAWDCWAYIAYGFKALTYFNYVCPGTSDDEGECFNSSLIYRDGTIKDQALYDSVSALNWKMRAVGDILMKYDCAHAYHTVNNCYGNNVEYLPSTSFIQTNDTKDYVISMFKPKEEGSDSLIMLFNNDWKAGNTATFTLDPYSGIEKLEYFDPETKKYENVDISSDSFTVTFDVGEARLYRVTGISAGEMY
jgi:hypothetical protein